MTTNKFIIHRTWDGRFRVEEGGCLSAPMNWEALGRELGVLVATTEEKCWSKPIAVAPKRPKPQVTEAQTLYEIRGGKVQRIASDAKERQAQQMAELMALVEGSTETL